MKVSIGYDERDLTFNLTAENDVENIMLDMAIASGAGDEKASRTKVWLIGDGAANPERVVNRVMKINFLADPKMP